MVASASTRSSPQIFGEDAPLPTGPGSLGIEGWAFLEVSPLPFFRPLGQLLGIALPTHIHHEGPKTLRSAWMTMSGPPTTQPIALTEAWSITTDLALGRLILWVLPSS